MTTKKPPAPCSTCGRLTLPGSQIKANPALREMYATRKGGDCNPCYMRRYNHRTPSTVQPFDELCEDVEWLIGTDSPDRIARRVGYANQDALARRFYRHGRRDLARVFEQHAEGMAS